MKTLLVLVLLSVSSFAHAERIAAFNQKRISCVAEGFTIAAAPTTLVQDSANLYRVTKENEVKTLYVLGRDVTNEGFVIYSGIAQKNNCPDGCQVREQFGLKVPNNLKERTTLFYLDESSNVKSKTEFRCSYVEIDNR